MTLFLFTLSLLPPSTYQVLVSFLSLLLSFFLFYSASTLSLSLSRTHTPHTHTHTHTHTYTYIENHHIRSDHPLFLSVRRIHEERMRTRLLCRQAMTFLLLCSQVEEGEGEGEGGSNLFTLLPLELLVLLFSFFDMPPPGLILLT